MKKIIKMIITGGGTGGHLYPALAIGEEIKSRNYNTKVRYVGSSFGIEKDVFPIINEKYNLLPIRGLQRGISIKSLARNFLLPYRLLRSIIQVKNIFNTFEPNIIIGTGGYASALPLREGLKRKIPILLQEQNSYPGITTRWFANSSNKVCIGFKEAQHFIEKKCLFTGNPVRKNIGKANKIESLKSFELKENLKTIFLFGGSQGSSLLNDFMKNNISAFKQSNIQIIWQTGERQYSKLLDFQDEKIKIIPFINNMSTAYAASDIIISRSGALTCSEILLCKKPAILIPFQNAAGNHQEKNANALKKAGACKMILEQNLNNINTIKLISNLLNNKNKLKKMSDASNQISKPKAATQIVDEALNIINEI